MPLVNTSAILTVVPSPSDFEQQVTMTCTVTANSFNVAPPSGLVNFFDGFTLLASVNLTPLTPTSTISTAMLPITILLAGTHNLSAVYVGDVNYIGTTAVPNPFIQQVNSVAVAAPELPGFGLIASFVSTGDSSLPPQATLAAVPNMTHAHTSVTLLWDTINVGQIEITGNNGFDPPFDTGRLSTNGSGIYINGNGWTHTILLTLTAYDATGHPLGLTSAVQITIT